MTVDLFALSSQLFTAWLLVFGRVIALFSSMPLIGEKTVPWQARVGISMFTAWLLLPLARLDGPLPDTQFLALGLCFCREVVLGLCIGYMCRLLFGAFQFAVNAIDFQMGLSFMQLVDPAADARLSVVGQFLNSLLLLLFLALDGHHILIRALAQTFGAVPLGSMIELPQLLGGMIQMFAFFVAVALQIALPTVTVLLLIDVAMGIIGRVVPQLQVFVISLPIKIIVGLMTIWLTLPALYTMLGRLLAQLEHDLVLLVRMLR